jgi:hypothetical protein
VLLQMDERGEETPRKMNKFVGAQTIRQINDFAC